MAVKIGIVFLISVTCAVLLMSLMVGSVTLGLPELISVLTDTPQNSVARTILIDIRLPRVLLALLVGAGISASGAAIQGLFRNPLADPALIGVSSGAALFAALFVVIAGQVPHLIVGMAGSAFVGGMLATWIVLLVGGRGGGISTMLLAGIAINAIALAGVGLLSYLSTDTQLRSISFWALGSLNGASWTSVSVAAVIPIVLYFLYRQSSSLNAMTLGEETAMHLGVSSHFLRIRIVSLTAIAVGIGVALTGVIAFLGLIVPHLIRMTLGSKHQVVIPASGLLGGLLLLVADSLSRTIVAPVELPVGILTALIGGPFFVYLILSQQKGRLVL
jgi:iron complex transport system permease protein